MGIFTGWMLAEMWPIQFNPLEWHIGFICVIFIGLFPVIVIESIRTILTIRNKTKKAEAWCKGSL